MVSGKEREMYMCFRAMGTKAAPGKGRELRLKWKNLSWVLQILSFLVSQLVWDTRGFSCLFSPNFSKTLG